MKRLILSLVVVVVGVLLMPVASNAAQRKEGPGHTGDFSPGVYCE